MRMLKALLSLFMVLLISGCGEEAVEGRWYAQAQVNRGKQVFVENCAECHGRSAQGAFNWRSPLDDGAYPPPPLNGSAHAWHHSFDTLMRTIDKGGIPVGGQMPAFEDKLSEGEKEAAIAYFQSQWDDRIYKAWLDRGGR